MKSSKVNTGDSILASQYNNLRDDAKGASSLLVHQQTTPNMTLYVEPGICYIGNQRIIFGGGSSPTFTAPTSNPRIDLLTINSSGVLEIVQGTEGATPSPPSYPNNKLTLCEVYHRVGETALYDEDTAGQGYILRDVRPFLGGAYISSDDQVDPNAAIQISKIRKNSDIEPESDNTYSLGSSSKQWKELRTKKVFINNIELMSAKFGGTGVDGALNISSGTTTINLGGQRLVVKNYTSISITGTGKLTFTNPHSNGTIIVLKSQGNVTLTSSTNPNIDVSGLGGNSNTSGWGFVCGPSSESYGGYSATFRGSEQSLMTPNPGVGTHIVPTIESLTIPVFCGAGGGSGVIGGGPGDPYGGRGGGGLYIECGGDLNMTGNIWAKGQNGGTSSYPLDLYNAIAGSGGGGAEDGSCGQFTWRLIGYQTIGFGGGGGGCVYILYRGTLVAASGTIDVSGGSGGSGAASGGSGGAGSYNIEKNQYIN